MSHQFLQYLLFLLGLILVFVISYYISFKRSTTITNTPSTPISGGTVSVLMDPFKQITIIPYAKNKRGSGKATNHIEHILPPYKPNVVGHSIRTCMELSQIASPCSDSEFTALLGNVGWKTFSEDKRNISIHFDTQRGIVFHLAARESDGTFTLYTSEPNAVLPNNASDIEIGNVVVNLMAILDP